MLVIEILKLIPKMLIEFKQCMPLTIYLDMHSQSENVKPEPESGLLSEEVIFGGAHLGFVIISIAAASSAFSCARQSFAAGQPHIAHFHIGTGHTLQKHNFTDCIRKGIKQNILDQLGKKEIQTMNLEDRSLLSK